MQTNVNWFEIATKDLTRAARFYETVFATRLHMETLEEESPMAIFQRDDGQSVGCLTGGQWIEPSLQGTLVYLDAGPSIQAVIDRIVPAGGKIALEKTQLPKELGYICQFIDTEGNRIALHAMN
ncbi:VOC family protein [Herbaspirillum sp. WKF16]|jgi:predicted enzyme related to lactoylglutathione lyase|uniref:VOC family protein n=1 Tax=Herbaspirillum sp. WKF16 TaxID=3028312 RepID=UPI0023A9E3C6|nr:VOC family protein [Herbaspirillum sp. WKF16]WDZ96649.1 VOC family protein [Herbaspirillum sp. WKF16]